MKFPPVIILIGSMGSGKTSTGKALAKKLRFDFLDTDHWIEEKNKKTIPQIFAQEGEDYFREQEKKAVEWAKNRSDIVISTGGGLWMNEANRKELLALGWCVWLRVSAQEAWKRIKQHSEQRPLLKRMHSSASPIGTLREMLEKRNPIYQLAHRSFSTDEKTTKQLVLEISSAFKKLNG